MDSQCSKCKLVKGKKICRNPENNALNSCSTRLYRKSLEKAGTIYNDPEIKRFATEASRQESSCYKHLEKHPESTIPTKPRIVEIIEFCKRMKYKRIGFAFCGGLEKEAVVIEQIFEESGLNLISVVCKVGGVDKSKIGVLDCEKINGHGHESMCNPIGQAMILNEANTEFNIMLGLCVGHDSLFLKYVEAMCTILAVKDRVTGHNPLAVVYTNESYYKYIRTHN